jgi:hypothetical protein
MKIEKEFLIFKRLLGRNQARPSHAARSLQDSEAGLGAAPAQRSGAHRARGDGDTHTQSGLHGVDGGERLRHEPRQGFHHEHPRRTMNLPDLVESSNSKRGSRATEGVKFTGARRQCQAAPMVRKVSHASGSCSEVIGCSGHASGSCSEVVGEVGHTSGSCSNVIGCSGHTSGSCSEVVGEVGHASVSCSEVVGEVSHASRAASM